MTRQQILDYDADSPLWVNFQQWVRDKDDYSYARALKEWATDVRRVWWLYTKVGFDNATRESDILATQRVLQVDRLDGVLGSSRVYRSAEVLYSEDVEDSSEIHNSQHIRRSKNIFDSKWVADSELVESSSLITGSKQVYHSSNTKDSQLIADSSGVINSWGIRSSKLIQNSGLCANSSNLNNCLMCFGLSDKKNHIFNQPVDAAFLEMFTTLVVPVWQSMTFTNTESYYTTYGYNLSAEARELICTLPHFDAGIAYAITLDEEWLK